MPSVSAAHLDIVPLFGRAYSTHRVRVRARRLLKATGMDIRRLPAFPLSSTRVRSVGVSDPVLSSREFLESQAPVYIIGSGKSAMDCVQHIAQRSARRRSVGIVLGSGRWFLSRDHLFPTGPWRFTHGALVGDVFLRICELFDGQNERELMLALQREKIAIHVFGMGLSSSGWIP